MSSVLLIKLEYTVKNYYSVVHNKQAQLLHAYFAKQC